MQPMNRPPLKKLFVCRVRMSMGGLLLLPGITYLFLLSMLIPLVYPARVTNTSVYKNVAHAPMVSLSYATSTQLCSIASNNALSSKPTPGSKTPAGAMQTYKGNGFSISYPCGMQEKATSIIDPQDTQGKTSVNSVAFQDPVSKNVMTIATAPNPFAAQGTSKVAVASMQMLEKLWLSNAQPATIAPTATVGGETWVQLSATGDLTLTDPGTQGTLIELANTHPASGAHATLYEITYGGPTSTFAQANKQFFQPMLASFKFTS